MKQIQLPMEVRRAQYISAAATVIAKHGVSGATTRRLAEEAGASAGTLHYCFSSKEEIFYELFKSQALAIRDAIGSGPPDTGLFQAAAKLLSDTVAWFRSEPEFARAQFELLLWSLRQPEYPDLAAYAYDVHHEVFCDSLRSSLRTGDDPDQLPSVARATLAMVDGIILQWFAYGANGPTDATIVLSVELLRTKHDSLERPSP